MYAGAHGVANNLDNLLRAAALVQTAESSLTPSQQTRFLLVGDGKNKAALMALAAELGLSNTEFRPAVPKAAVHGTLQSADVLALPVPDKAIYRHGISPNKLFDYFAAGRPVVIALHSEHDPVRAAGAGVTVQPDQPEAMADAILKLRALDPADRTAMGMSGRDFVAANHNIDHLALSLEAVLARVMSARQHQ
ncbi:glycosyltransferase [Knoellia koreensis]|nr:glycosyltransferase [Knoellia sp. DB2414S]